MGQNARISNTHNARIHFHTMRSWNTDMSVHAQKCCRHNDIFTHCESLVHNHEVRAKVLGNYSC